MLVHYALGIPYAGQHGDDLERWERAYGPFPDGAGPGLGMAPAPPVHRQPEHVWALAIADVAIEQARRRAVRIAVAIVDERGDPIQQDRMDGAPTASVQVAEATAAAAATFACPSDQLSERYPGDGALTMLAATLPFRILAVPGGLPIDEDGRTVAAVGVAGPAPAVCAEIAAAARAGAAA